MSALPARQFLAGLAAALCIGALPGCAQLGARFTPHDVSSSSPTKESAAVASSTEAASHAPYSFEGKTPPKSQVATTSFQKEENSTHQQHHETVRNQLALDTPPGPITLTGARMLS